MFNAKPPQTLRSDKKDGYNKLIELIKKYKTIVISLAVTFILLVVTVFGYFIYAEPSALSIISAKVFDNTESSLTLSNGETFSQTFQTESEIGYIGFFIKDFYTGTIEIELIDDKTNAVLGSGTISSSEVIKDAFNVASIGTVVKANAETVYRIEASVNTGEQAYPVVLGYTNAATGNFNLKVEQKHVDGTLGVLVRTGPIGTFILKYYLAVMLAISICAGVLTWVCLSKKFKVHTTFGIVILTIGCLFMLVFSPYNSPDGKSNINTAFTYSFRLTERFFPAQNAMFISGVYMRPSDGNEVLNVDYSSPYTYKETVEHFFEKSPDKAVDQKSLVEPSADFAEMTVFGAIAVTLARFLRIGFVGALYLGRFFNLFVYALCASFAIKKVPDFLKNSFIIFCSLPMVFNITTSFNRDNLLICLALVFTALCLNLAYDDDIKNISTKQLISLCVVAFFLAPLKIIYFPIVVLCLLIPNKKFSSPKTAVYLKLSVLFTGIISYFMYNSAVIVSYFTRVLGFSPITHHEIETTATQTRDLVSSQPVQQTIQTLSTAQTTAETTAVTTAVPEILTLSQATTSLGDAHNVLVADTIMYTPQYILENLVATIKLLATTFFEKTDDYILGIFGHSLGNYNVEINLLFVFSFMLLMFVSLIRKEGDPVVSKNNKLLCVSIVGVVWLLTLASNILWTPTYYETIFGVLDRYILPAVPILFLALSIDRIRLKKDITYPLIASVVLLNCFVIINAFTVALGR